MKSTVAVVMLLVALVVVAPRASAQSPGGVIYAAQGASVPEFFMLTITGQTFVAAILTFGPSGNNGRWFAATGTTDGVNGSGQVIVPSGKNITEPGGSSFTFKLDGPGASTGSFTIVGLEFALSLNSGRWARIFP